MSKRKRGSDAFSSSSMSSNNPSKKPSSKRSHLEADDDDEVSFVGEFMGPGSSASSSKKKKRVEKPVTREPHQAVEVNPPPPPPYYAQAAAKPVNAGPSSKTSAKSHHTSDVPQRNGKDLGRSIQSNQPTTHNNGGPATSQFKIPEVPRRTTGPAPSTSKASTSTSSSVSVQQPKPSQPEQEEKSKKEKESPKENQLKNTERSKRLRKAFTDAILEALGKTSQGDFEYFADLIYNMRDVLPDRPYLFATRRLPEGPKFEDCSKDSEIEEFARCWLFGVTVLLFSSPESLVKQIIFQAKNVLTSLCQLLLRGHPAIVDRISVPLFKVLKDLLVRSPSGGPPKLNFNFHHSQDDSGKKINNDYAFDINLIEDNDWVIPHYIQAISPLLTRICLQNVKIFHLFNDILRRLLGRLTTPETVASVLACFPSFVLTDAHTFYLTENVCSNVFECILQSPSLPKTDMPKMRRLFSQHDGLQSSTFAEFLQNSGLALLRVGIKEFLRSDKFALINDRDDLNRGIIQAFRFVVEGSHKPLEWVEEETPPLIQLLSRVGMSAVLHPLIERIILSEMMSDSSICDEPSYSATYKPRESSALLNRILESFEKSFREISQSLSMSQSPQEPQISEEKQLELITFFSNTASLLKLAVNLVTQLRDDGCYGKFLFFEPNQLQKWLDFASNSLANGLKLKEENLQRLYSSILDTIGYFDACNWFGANLSARFFNNIISIPGLLWLSKFEGCLPPKLKPFPVFTKKYSSSSSLHWIKGSSRLVSKALRILRLEVFRSWRCFVAEVYMSVMENQTLLGDPFLVMELLSAIADVNWVYKKTIPLTTTFTFLENVIQTDLWKGDSCVRSLLGLAVSSMPCVCYYNVNLNSSNSKTKQALNNGCGKNGCTAFSEEAVDEDEQEGPDKYLDDLYNKAIVNLAKPLLKSRFLGLKRILSDLITNSHNHAESPAASIIIPMIEVALNGHKILCEEIFRKIGLIFTNLEPSSTSNGNGTDTDLVHRIFSSAIPELCARKQANTPKNRLPLRTREKIIKGIVTFSTVGPMNMSIFVEILKCVIPIVAHARINENSVTVLSQRIVTHFAETHKCQPHELLTRVRHEISKCIVKSSLKEFYQRDLPATVYQANIIRCVKFIERLQYIGKFRISFVRYIYPALIELIVPNIRDKRYQFLLSCLASHEKESEPFLLQEYIMHYFPSLLLDHSPETITSCLKFLKENYGFDAMFTAKEQEQRILNEALCRLSDREDKVKRFLSHLCKWDEKSSEMLSTHGTAAQATGSELRELLSQRLLGFFIHLDTKLQSRIETVESKRNIIRSFTALIKLMGKGKITPVRSKVYKTLYAATKDGPQFHEVLYDAWREFVNNLTSEIFASMTPQILASILPLRNSPSVRSKVDGLMSHFVCFKKDLTAIHHPELYFVEDDCDNPVVKLTINGAVEEMKNKNWLDYFNMIVREASNENAPIRYQAFKQLRNVFQFEWERVEKFVLVKGKEYVSKLISTLLTGLRGIGCSEDLPLRSIIVDCFGSVGALDPVRFRSRYDDGNSARSLSTSLAISCQMSNFVVLYLNELIREFQEVKDTTNFDYCACLIQIALKEMNVKQNSNDKIWKYLTKEQQEVVKPMFTTRYQMDQKVNLGDIDSPIYMSEHGKTFESWLIKWLCVLISYIDANKEPQAYSLFRKSMHVLKTNVRIATFIIPFVAMYAIFCANSVQRGKIVDEITTILQRWIILVEKKRKERNTITFTRDSEAENGLQEEEPLSVENESIFHARCTQVIFAILDHLLRSSTLAKRRWAIRKSEKSRHLAYSTNMDIPMTEAGITAVESVLRDISPLLISEVACNLSSYPAALYYLEMELQLMPFEETFQGNVDYLQRLYICLDDMDSVSGIPAVRRGNPSFAGKVLENIVNGKTNESIEDLCEMAKCDTDDFLIHQALVRAYLKVEEPDAAEKFIQSTLVRQPEWEVDIQEVQMETLIKLQKWPELDAKVDDLETMKGNSFLEEKFLSWNVAIPRIVSKIHRNETAAAAELLTELKSESIAPLVAICEEMYPYKRAYPHIVQLHILAEIDDAIKLLTTYTNAVDGGISNRVEMIHDDVIHLVKKWETRLWNVSKSRKMTDQILNVRKTIFQILKATFQSDPRICNTLDESIREIWLDIARDASKCGEFVQANHCLREAKKFMSPKVMIEEAKILSRKGENENAICILKKGIAHHFPKLEAWKKEENASILRPSVVGSPDVKQQKQLCSKALLLLAKLSEEEKLLDMDDYINKYKEASDVYKESEKNWFTLGSYHDRLWSRSGAEKTLPWFEVQANVVRYYSQSLLYGCKYVYQSLPRLLSIWFDFAAGLEAGEFVKYTISGIPATASAAGGSTLPQDINRPEKNLEVMSNAITRMYKNVPAYVLMTAFTQLVSRMCHSHAKTWALLKEIIVRIIKAHPHQTLWMTMAVHQSVNKMRRRRCMEVYSCVAQERGLDTTIKNYTTVTERFIELCNKKTENRAKTVSLTQLKSKLPQAISEMGSDKVAVPFQVFMNPSLPRKGVMHKDHNPYPESLVYFESVNDEVCVMQSLVQPKRITLRASNGKKYTLLCKPKDDLRKDSKVMEVNNVVNWYLSQNSESSQRRLHVRTYSVVPLNEECGLLEWVPNVLPFRVVIQSLYQEKNIPEVKIDRGDHKKCITKRDTLPEKKTKFIKYLLQPTPPVFGDWFFYQFNDHQSWYSARMAYIRTAAAMSIVGYVMGLGDRHLENILLDTSTGEVVHVDYNCLFNKGETFDWPERVPFRLTQNMEHGMGPLKYEGVFRKSCEIVLGMFRENKSIFLSVLRPFVFDPLVEWQKHDIRGAEFKGELTNEKAVETMKFIRHRLTGTARNSVKEINTELSVKAHVDYLIDEATSVDNLCQMWTGWAAHM